MIGIVLSHYWPFFACSHFAIEVFFSRFLRKPEFNKNEHCLLKPQEIQVKVILFSGVSAKYLSLEDFTAKLDKNRNHFLNYGTSKSVKPHPDVFTEV